MKIQVKSGGRGRPLTIDTEKLLATVNSNLGKAKQTLSQIRKSTSGYRGVEILGSNVELPEWLEETYTLIDMAQRGTRLSYQLAKNLRAGVRAVERLAGSRTKETALSEYFAKEFYEMIDYGMKNQSQFTKEQLRSMERTFRRMSPKQQQEFALSKGYQDIKTLSKKYRNIKTWAEKSSGRSLTYAEADAYLLKRRMQDRLSTEFIDELEF